MSEKTLDDLLERAVDTRHGEDVVGLVLEAYDFGKEVAEAALAYAAAELARSELARRTAEQKARDTKPCVICAWPQPMDNEHFICACCGFQPGYDDDKVAPYQWNGQWWSEQPKPQILEAAAERDAASSELEAIAFLVSDRSEAGTYAKVEAHLAQCAATARQLANLVEKWRKDAYAEGRVSFCADELEAVLRPLAPPQEGPV